MSGLLRRILANYEKVFAEITKLLNPEFNSYENILMCRSVVESFISRNLLEKTRLKECTMYLRVQYLFGLSEDTIKNPLEFMYKTLAEKLDLDFEMVRYDYEKARMDYIKKVNES